MSEFFKALEQAERDRQLAEATEQPTTATVVSGGEPRHDGRDEAEQAHVTDKLAAADPAPEPMASASAPPAAGVTPPATERPERGGRPSFFERPFERPSEPVRRAPVRPPSRIQERLAPVEPARPTPREQHIRPAATVDAGSPAPPMEQPAERPAPVQPAPPAAERPASPAPLTPPRPLKHAAPRARKAGHLPLLIADMDPRSVAAEAYRTLRANLEFGAGESGCRRVIITSPSMGEGKSTTAANLAVVAAQGGARVCVVDADMRRPALHSVFGVPNQGGFTRALGQGLPLSSVAVATGITNLSLVVAGSADGLQAAQLLNAPRLHRVLGNTETAYDLVVFDTPPVISVADAMNLAPHCDGVLLVVRAGAVTPAALRRAAHQIQQVNGKVLGVLLNHVDLRRGDVEYYRHYRAYHSTAAKG